MGLDVIFERNGHTLTWDNRIMGDFPFKIEMETFGEYNQHDEWEEITQEYIAEITGMWAFGSVSFRGRGYSWFVSEAGLPWDFYHSFSPDELKKETEALSAFLAKVSEKSDDFEMFDMRLGRIRNLEKLLLWAVLHKLGTYASY